MILPLSYKLSHEGEYFHEKLRRKSTTIRSIYKNGTKDNHLNHSLSEINCSFYRKITQAAQHLKLNQYITQSDILVLGQSNKFYQLKSIDLSGNQQIRNKALLFLTIYFPTLEKINLSGCEKISDEGLRSLAIYLPKLRKITIDNCPQITDDCISLLTTCFPNLKIKQRCDQTWVDSLQVTGFSFLASQFNQTANLNIIDIIDIIAPKKYIPVFVTPPLSNHQNIGSFISNLASSSMKLLPAFHTETKSIHLDKHLNVTNNDVISLITQEGSAFELRSIHLNGPHPITDEIIIWLANNCPQLQRIQLNECEQITHESLSLLGEQCSKLRSIDISGCQQITHESVCLFLEHYKSLVELTLPDDQTLLGTQIADWLNSQHQQNITIHY